MEKLREPVHLVLQRGKANDIKTLGVIQHNGKTLVYTLEEPWRNNAPGNPNAETESCIPPGSYKVIRHGWEPNATTHFKRVWRLLNVPGRGAILIHAGNTTADTEGCILVGMAPSNGGVRDSVKALDYLRAILPENGFTLEVRGAT